MKQLIIETLPGSIDAVENEVRKALKDFNDHTEIHFRTADTEEQRFFVCGYAKEYNHLSECHERNYFETIITLKDTLTNTKQIDNEVLAQLGYGNIEISCLTRL